MKTQMLTKIKDLEENSICVYLWDLIKVQFYVDVNLSGGELLEIWLLDSHLLDTFGRKSTARHEIDQLLESS